MDVESPFFGTGRPAVAAPAGRWVPWSQPQPHSTFDDDRRDSTAASSSSSGGGGGDGYGPTASIFAKGLDGKTITIPIRHRSVGATTVADVQEELARRTRIPASQQRLIYAGRQLEHAALLSDYGVVRPLNSLRRHVHPQASDGRAQRM